MNKNLLTEYFFLATLPELSEVQAKRFEAILEIAESDDFIGELINEADQLIAFQKGLLNDKNISFYKAQVAKIEKNI